MSVPYYVTLCVYIYIYVCVCARVCLSVPRGCHDREGISWSHPPEAGEHRACPWHSCPCGELSAIPKECDTTQ